MSSPKKMSQNKKAVIIVGIIIVALIGFAVLREYSNRYIFRERLDRNFITIDGEKLTVRDMCYYIVDVENTINEMALVYNPEDPMEFWNIHFKNSMNSVFTNEYARKLVRELGTYDYIMEKEAVKKDVSLSLEEEITAKKEAQEFYNNLSGKAKENTELTLEQIEKITRRKGLVKKYVELTAQQMKEDGYDTSMTQQLEFDGMMYQNVIKINYEIEQNDREYDKLPMGTITIN